MGRNLSFGCAPGEDVRALQFMLNEVVRRGLGKTALQLLLEDGNFGAKTKARVAEFQKQQNLVSDGMAGPKTQGALSGMVGGASQPAGAAGPGGGKFGSGKFGGPGPGGDKFGGGDSGGDKFGGGDPGGKFGTGDPGGKYGKYGGGKQGGPPTKYGDKFGGGKY